MIAFDPDDIVQEWEARGWIEFDWSRGEFVYTERGKVSIQLSSTLFAQRNGLYNVNYQSKEEAKRRIEVLTDFIPLLVNNRGTPELNRMIDERIYPKPKEQA